MSSTRQNRKKKKRKIEQKRRASGHAPKMPGVQFRDAPPGLEKMSEVFRDFLDPYWHLWRNEEDLRRLLTLGMAAWNAAVVTGEEREKLIQNLEQTMPPEARADFRRMLENMCRHKELRYPHNKRLIVQYRFRDEGGTIHLQVASTAPALPDR